MQIFYSLQWAFSIGEKEGKRNYFSQLYSHERNTFKTDSFSSIFVRHFVRIYLPSYAVTSQLQLPRDHAPFLGNFRADIRNMAVWLLKVQFAGELVHNTAL
jgi:hypothetical protein